MPNKDSSESAINLAFGLFSTLRHAREMNNPTFVFDEAAVDSILDEILSIPSLSLDESSRTELKKLVFSRYEIYQDEGEALLSDYQYEPWYNIDGKDSRPFWDRYFNYLKRKNPVFSTPNNKLNVDTDKITEYLGDPKADSAFHRYGLVLGDVQSGKTATYIGLICKAVDAGYRVVILLTGTTESLRRQTQHRVDAGFIGYDSEKQEAIGVGRDRDKAPLPMCFTSTKSDYTGSNLDKNTAAQVNRLDERPVVFVCKKNTKVLTKLYNGLKKLNTSKNRQTIDAPILLIDDEADNASVNTNKPEEDPTAVNASIRKLLELFKQSSYVGFTATPFANVFIQPTEEDKLQDVDLFPKDFIYSLHAPSNYIGPFSIFSPKGKNHKSLVYLDDAEKNLALFSHQHKKDWDGNRLFPSFYEAILVFCLGNAVRDIRAAKATTKEGKADRSSHRSMLINMSRFIAVQNKIKDLASEYFDTVKNAVHLFGKSTEEKCLSNPIMKDIHRVWIKHFEGKVDTTWFEVRKSLYSSLKDIKLIVVNSKQASKLNYDDYPDGLRVIAVGGLALSRGLTLEGLMVSYFYRNTKTYDVLMQMGRWFGYRDLYADLTRIWIPRSSARWYGEIAEAIDELRTDIKRMCNQHKTPIEFGIRVRNDSDELGITAPNKMRNTLDRVERTSFYGTVFENTYADPSHSANEKNWELVKELANHLPLKDPNVSKPYFRNISKGQILKLLDGIILPRVSARFDREQIVNFLNTANDSDLDYWDVLLFDKDTDESESLDDEGLLQSGCPVKPVELTKTLKIHPILRDCSIATDGAIAISGARSRVGSIRDTSYGLSKEEKEEAEKERQASGKKTTSETFMIAGRRPLLIVYAVMPQLTREQGDASFVDSCKMIKSAPYGSYAAFAIGFPRSVKAITRGESHLYKVNRGADYYSSAGYASEESNEE